MNYHKIEKTSVANGTGIRVVLWLSGCSLHCKGCQNPETWDCNSGQPFTWEAKQEMYAALKQNHIQGITFSGGHPLEESNVEAVLDLIMEIRALYPKKDIWLYTGWTWESIFDRTHDILYDNIREQVIRLCDVVVDGPYVERLKDITLKWRGSSNQRVIDVQKSLSANAVVLYEK